MSIFVGKELIPEGQEENTIYEIIKENDLKNYTIAAKAGSINGDNYLGTMIAIDIKGEKSTTGEYTELHLMLKSSNRNGVFVDYLPSSIIFDHEIHMYTKYLPKLYELQKQKQIKNGLLPVAKVYKYSSTKADEYIIMENLKCCGFQMTDRKTTLDMDHSKLVLTQLGYFHALSYTLKTQDPNTYEALTNYVKDYVIVSMLDENFKNYLEGMIDKASTVVDADKEKDIFEKTQRLKDYGFQSYFCDLAKAENFDDKYSVMIHGDCWNNNILFKYDESNKPIELCFLDWQISRRASPAIDLVHFAYMCLGPEMLENHFDSLLQTYYNALSEMLANFELKAEIILPFSVLQSHLEQYGGYGVTFAINGLQIFISDSDEIPEIRKMETFDAEALSLFNYQSKNHDLYVKRMRGILLHAVSRKFIT